MVSFMLIVCLLKLKKLLQASENHFGVPEQLLWPGEVTHGCIAPVPRPPCAPSMSQRGANVIRVSGIRYYFL
jgi:hypothetical protein